MPVSAHHVGFAHLDTNGKSVTIVWSHFPTPKIHVGRTTQAEAFTTSYWPTGIAPRGGSVLYVGGTRANGETVIERWTFEIPTPLPEQAEIFERTSVTSIYSARASGRTHVAQLAPTVGFPGVVVQYHDSRDLWIYRESTAAWTLGASPVSGPALLVPELSEVVWTTLGALSHKTLGAMYVLGSDTLDHCLVIWDGNKDGVLDSSRTLDTQAWAAGGFNDSSQYDLWE